MKLVELAAQSPTKQIARVFESQFSQRISFDTLSSTAARQMLDRVRQLVAEHKSSSRRHSSERDPNYLKLMMMEQALSQHILDINRGTVEKRVERALLESEVQQAQVVLAAQDMVDRVQKMLEDTTEMQFKELPALVDSIRNQIGIDQATQFNNDATASLQGLVQNLQGTKQQLEQALGVVTGQPMAPVAAPADAMAAAPTDAEVAPTDDLNIDANVDVEEPLPGTKASAADLGRERR
jgi:hypothetical protein